MSKVSIKDAEEAHKSIVTSQQKKIAQLYEQWADEIAAEAKKYQGMSTSSAVLKSQQLTQLEGALRKAGEQTANAVSGEVKQGMLKASNSVINDNAEWLESLGFPSDGIAAAFSSVPTSIVQNLVTGQIYQQGWSLSKSIWSDSEDTMARAYQVVAGGMAENKSIYEIAKDLEQFVSPSAAKPWNYTFKGIDKVTGEEKTYRVYPKKVDYNAQRLARTLSQHAYQQTMVAVNKDNPFVQKFRWHAIGGRACPICLARNGKLFDKNNIPMDHPNGMCILEPVYDKDVNQRLADWVNGKEDPALDRYAKQFGATSGDIAVKGGKSGMAQGDPNAINTWHRRNDEFDFEIEDAMNYQGFDGLPRLVDADEFDKIVKDSSFIAQRTYSAGSQEILDAYRDQLYHGKWYVDCSTGGAQYGQGMYCAADWQGKLTEGIKAEMKHYQDLNRDRTLAVAKADYMSKLSAKDVMKSAYMDGAKVSDDEWKAYVKLKSDPNLTLYKLPPDDRKLVEAIQDRGDWTSLGLAVDDVMEEFEQSYKGYSYTETLTLDPSAKVIKYSDLVSMAEEEGVTIYDRESARMTAQSAYKMLYGKNWYDLTDDEQNAFLDEMKKNANFEDIGSYAVLKGYDVINAEGHGESGSYTVVLNRTKLVIKKG